MPRIPASWWAWGDTPTRRGTGRPEGTALVPGSGHLELACRLLTGLGPGANLTTGVQVAAHAIEHGGEVHSNDSDFGRFDGLRWLNPLRST